MLSKIGELTRLNHTMNVSLRITSQCHPLMLEPVTSRSNVEPAALPSLEELRALKRTLHEAKIKKMSLVSSY